MSKLIKMKLRDARVIEVSCFNFGIFVSTIDCVVDEVSDSACEGASECHIMVIDAKIYCIFVGLARDPLLLHLLIYCLLALSLHPSSRVKCMYSMDYHFHT